jgi:Tol biopolymer transport system component
VWSPDGTKVAFVRSLGRKVDLYVVDARTSRVRRIATRVAPESRPSWSPDGRRLVYSRIGPTAPVELPDVVVVREDGKKRLRIGAGRTPLWSPVGGAIAFAGYDGLDIVRPDGRRLRQVVTPGPAALWSWSADGELLAFSGKGLDVVAAAGGPAHVVALEGWRAAWAPRRRRVAYTNGCGLGVFDVTDDPSHYDASIPPPCLPVGVEGFPSWSSDGAKIVFSFCRSLLGCLVESGVAGRISGLEATRIVCGIDPQWSPVADEVVFASSEPSRSLPCPAAAPTSLYLMQPDGTGIRRLTGRAR